MNHAFAPLPSLASMEAPVPTESSTGARGAAGVTQTTHARGAASREFALPNLVIIGAQKCGTSGLHYYLGLHPEVSMSTPKELNYFIAERNWGRGPEWLSLIHI